MLIIKKEIEGVTSFAKCDHTQLASMKKAGWKESSEAEKTEALGNKKKTRKLPAKLANVGEGEGK